MTLEASHDGLALNVAADIAGRLDAETITRTLVGPATSHPITLVRPVTEVFGNLFEDADEVVSTTPDWRGFTLPAAGRKGNVDVESRFFPGVGRESAGDLPNVSVEAKREASGGRVYVGPINVALWTQSIGLPERSDEEWDFNSSAKALYLGAQPDDTGSSTVLYTLDPLGAARLKPLRWATMTPKWRALKTLRI